MEVHHLIYELRQGIRLSGSTFCPKDICELIQTCFLEDPEKRPDFRKIKASLLSAYDTMMTSVILNQTTNQNKSGEMCYKQMKINQVENNTMKERYLTLQMENESLSCSKILNQENEKLLKEEGNVIAMTYVSIGNIITEDTDHTSSANFQIEATRLQMSKANNYRKRTSDI